MKQESINLEKIIELNFAELENADFSAILAIIKKEMNIKNEAEAVFKAIEAENIIENTKK